MDIKNMTWAEKGEKLRKEVRLRYEPLAFKCFDDKNEMLAIKDVVIWGENYKTFTFCQLPDIVRNQDKTIGSTHDGNMFPRCKRTHGLEAVTEATMREEAEMLATSWMPDAEGGYKQQQVYPRVPLSKAIVMGPVSQATYEPDMLLVYATPGQMMWILCGMQKIEYERYEFHFIGEGACADSIAQCYETGKPALALPCFGERLFGSIMEDEMLLAIPPRYFDMALEGIEKLKNFIQYPPAYFKGEMDISALMKELYPDYVNY